MIKSGSPDADRSLMGNIITPVVAEPPGSAQDRRGSSEQERSLPLTERREGERVGKGGDPARKSGRSSRMIGEVVVDLGFADRDTVEEAVRVAREQGKPTGEVLVAQGVLRADQLARVVAERFGLDYVDLSVYDLDMGAVHLIGADAAKRYRAVPVGFTDDGALLLAMADPTNVLTIDDVAMITGRRVRVAVASVEDLGLLLT